MKTEIRTLIFLFFLFFISLVKAEKESVIDLSGKWNFIIDRNDEGESLGWFNTTETDDSIILPGSMPERGKGDKVTINTKFTGSIYDSSFYFNPAMEKYRKDDNIKFPFFLTPQRYYSGAAWYIRETDIPDSWKGKKIFLSLERPHIESTVWVNGQKAGYRNSLSVAHEYDLSDYIKPGKAIIAVRIDNRMQDVNVGPDSHSITDQTQGNWNGIAGKIELKAYPEIHFSTVNVFPCIETGNVTVKMILNSEKDIKAFFSVSAESFNSPDIHAIPAIRFNHKLKKGFNEIETTLKMGDEFLLWDEFNPALYHLNASVETRYGTDERKIRFGMRSFEIRGKWFYVNGRQTMLRGTVDGCCFPLTGYPPTDVESWIKIYSKCKEFGLNHMRFHSYCPPEAAFEAADLVGIYIQPEGPSWPNHGSSLGDGKAIDRYLLEETIAINRNYGNYPSFCMLAAGNEPYGRYWVDWVSDFVDFWKKEDSRRVYTGASVGGGWAWQPKNQFHVKAGARGVSWKKRPETISDFISKIDTVGQPFVSHETGQWCVFPDFDEIEKYSGVNKAGNFEIFRDLLSENDMSDMAHKFKMASGKLQTLCYKHEMERTFKTPDYAGFQLLALNDYSGQGTALVGVLNVFYEEKGYVTGEEFRRFCAPTVLLSRIPKFTYLAGEEFSAEIEISHFDKLPMTDAVVEYCLKDDKGKDVISGTVRRGDIQTGQSHLGKIETTLPDTEIAKRLSLILKIKDTDIVNEWDIWVYPKEPSLDTGDVYVTDTLDDKTIKILEQGGNVLLTIAGKVSYGDGIKQFFQPAFWNTSWFKMRPPHTTGIYAYEDHPVFDNFPTSYHSDLQWWELLHNSQVMLLSDFPAGFRPLVHSIDTWFLSRKLGLLIEANVLNGKLIATSMDISSDPEKRIVARQLKHSILTYMNSESFKPADNVGTEMIRDLFIKDTPPVNMFTKGTPDELKPKFMTNP